MAWANKRLDEESEIGSLPSTQTPSDWTDQAIAQNPDLMDQSIPWLTEKDIHPETMETFGSLILSLFPTEGGL